MKTFLLHIIVFCDHRRNLGWLKKECLCAGWLTSRITQERGSVKKGVVHTSTSVKHCSIWLAYLQHFECVLFSWFFVTVHFQILVILHENDWHCCVTNLGIRCLSMKRKSWAKICEANLHQPLNPEIVPSRNTSVWTQTFTIYRQLACYRLSFCNFVLQRYGISTCVQSGWTRTESDRIN